MPLFLLDAAGLQQVTKRPERSGLFLHNGRPHDNATDAPASAPLKYTRSLSCIANNLQSSRCLLSGRRCPRSKQHVLLQCEIPSATPYTVERAATVRGFCCPGSCWQSDFPHHSSCLRLSAM